MAVLVQKADGDAEAAADENVRFYAESLTNMVSGTRKTHEVARALLAKTALEASKAPDKGDVW